MDEHLLLTALFEGYYPSEMLVDHPDQPKTAFVWMRHRGYVAGKASGPAFGQALGELFASEINPQRAAPFRFYFTPEWEGVFTGQVLSRYPPSKFMRQYYTRPAAAIDWHAMLPDGFEVLPIDGALPDSDLDNHLALVAEICSMNPSVETFLQQRFGVYARHGDSIAGWCLSEHNSGPRCDIGIETVEAFQRRGVATAMALAFIDLAHQKGIQQVGWDCWAENLSSVATARKAGFGGTVDYPVLVVWPPEAST